jgi:hypothetical protein
MDGTRFVSQIYFIILKNASIIAAIPPIPAQTAAIAACHARLHRAEDSSIDSSCFSPTMTL